MIASFEHKGKWKLPNTDEWIDGTLSFNPDTGAKLELFGTFNTEFNDWSKKEIILGETTAGDITLVENWFRTTRHSNRTVIIGVYEPIYIIEGQHFSNLNEINFRNVTFSVFNLFQWLNKSGIQRDYADYPKKYIIDYKELDRITFKLNENCNGYISYESSVNPYDIANEIQITEQCYITLKYSDKTNFEDILNDIAFFTGFTTLFTFAQSYPISISFKDDEYVEVIHKRQKIKQINCFYANTLYNSKHKLRLEYEHLVCYKDIQDIFPLVIENWFNKYSELEPVFNLMLYSFREYGKFSTENFMDVLKGVETFHRRTENNNQMPSSEYASKVKDILSKLNLDKGDSKWLEDRLRYGNEPSLKSRLVKLLEIYSNSYLVERITNSKRFFQQVVDTRNYYTHFDSSLENRALKHKDLFQAYQMMLGLLLSCLFRYIGLENSHFEQGLKNKLKK